ncbi:hypothetical protein KY49_6928 [Burkholderia sp. MSHR3999]|nr:hypothetical protein KY49_6928 [Burkholderia sp. MSHR3999]
MRKNRATDDGLSAAVEFESITNNGVQMPLIFVYFIGALLGVGVLATTVSGGSINSGSFVCQVAHFNK